MALSALSADHFGVALMSQFSRSLELSKSSDEWAEAVGIGTRELPLTVAEDLP